jgi:hypothetical protein
MFRQEACNIVDVTIENYPAALCRVMLRDCLRSAIVARLGR